MVIIYGSHTADVYSPALNYALESHSVGAS